MSPPKKSNGRNTTPPNIGAVPRLGLSRDETSAAMGVSVRLVDELIAGAPHNGFPVARINSRVVIPTRELTEWLAEQASEKN